MRVALLSLGFVVSALAAPLNSTASTNSSSPTVYGNVTVYQPGIDFIPNNTLPVSFARSKAQQIVAAFANLGRSTKFRLNNSIDFGSYVEGEGMVRIGTDRFVISHNVYTNATSRYSSPINGTDRTPGSGYGKLTIVDASGARIADVNLSSPGALEYHNGGIDYDGRYVWANLAQYRPNSTFTLVRIDPIDLSFEHIARFCDHAGGPIVTDTGDIVNLNWGSRNATVYNIYDNTALSSPAFTEPTSPIRTNPSSYVDWQDCKFLARIEDEPLAFCSGVSQLSPGNAILGGLAIVNTDTLAPKYKVPLTNLSTNGWPLTQNPSDIDFVDGHLRFWFFPDQGRPQPLASIANATMYIVDAL